MAPILEARNLTKRFPGVVALNEVTFDLQPGEVHALCGENGAGKSTLIKTLSGIHPFGSYEGEFRVRGEPARFRTLKDAEAAGLAVIYQELALVEEMSVAENIFLGHEPRRGPLVDWDAAYAQAAKLLAEFQIEIDPDLKVRELGVGQKQLIEIVKALGKKSQVLILDEPTAALAESEVAILLRILRDLRTSGVACIYISHKLGEVKAIADRITVLRDGSSITTLVAAQVEIPDIIRHMVGREIKELFPRDRTQPVGETLLKVNNLSVAPSAGEPARLKDVTFEVRAGEVLGIGGLMGAGRSELLLHLFGAWGARQSGDVRLGSESDPAPEPRDSIHRGLVMVTDDRKRYGLLLEQPIGFNLSLSSLEKVTQGGLVDEVQEARLNQKFFDALRVKAPGLDVAVGGLSGGNQQKVVIGKALMTEPRVVFLDEPTRGIDVGAKLEVYQLINRLTADGKAVVLVSSELPELMGMSDRILMLHEGQVGGMFLPSEFTQEALLAAAMGSKPKTDLCN
ncbi:MAG TPA: sugar ABC transporter ATP-binding protein [Verrucomicrobiota bacterium]|nr:D-xylose ABC transporter ATP-binding protein [Verrucomicrobiales bacterium]HRI13110.1 sugar ABC transporter ATP-binding protein [Verrucomicrobiota bacterium]